MNNPHMPLIEKLASKSGHSFAFHAAIVKKGGNILSSGHNHAVRHAEVDALQRMDPRARRGTVVWSVRLAASGHLRMGRPCDKCMEYLKKNGVKAVVYSNSNGELIKERI